MHIAYLLIVYFNFWFLLYYRDVLLSQQLLPVMREVSGEFVFQQDSALAHRARDTVRLLEQATPAFIPPDLWPANSPDLERRQAASPPVAGSRH